MPDRYALAVIVASVRVDRVGPVVARWFLSQVDEQVARRVDLIDLADLELPGNLGGGEESERFAKPVGFVSYGGSSGGMRAVEQLRSVFGELHVATMQTGVVIPHVSDAFDDDGRLRHPRHAEAAAATLLRQLDWWARALATAREDRPYEFARP